MEGGHARGLGLTKIQILSARGGDRARMHPRRRRRRRRRRRKMRSFR